MRPTLINLLQGRPFILRRLIGMWLFARGRNWPVTEKTVFSRATGFTERGWLPHMLSLGHNRENGQADHASGSLIARPPKSLVSVGSQIETSPVIVGRTAMPSLPTGKHAGSGAASNRPDVAEPTCATRARTLLYLGRIGTLSTLSRKQQGFPFGSVMPYGLDENGRPIFLISTMPFLLPTREVPHPRQTDGLWSTPSRQAREHHSPG
jgi:hypothetical protein